MHPDFLLCDICQSKLSISQRLHVTYAKEMDSAGSMDDKQVIIDLCDRHLRDALISCLLRENIYSIKPDFNNAEKLIKWLEIQKKEISQK